MKFWHIFLSAAVAAALAVAGMYSNNVSDWFSQSFAGLSDGTSFVGNAGQGAVDGVWDPIPNGVATVRTVEGRKCIKLDTTNPKLISREILFTATNEPLQTSYVDFSLVLAVVKMPPVLSGVDKGGLCILSTNTTGVIGFAGYTEGGWTNLYGRGLIQHQSEWIDCRAAFEYATNSFGVATNTYVTYYQDCGGGQYMPLVDANGTSRFVANTGKVSKVVFRGRGYVGDFAGFEVGESSSGITWIGPRSDGYWDEKKNWSGEKVPDDGDVAHVGGDKSIICTNANGECFIVKTVGEGVHELMYASGRYLRILHGDVTLTVPDADGFPGTVLVNSGSTLRIDGEATVGGIEMGMGSTLVLEPNELLTVTTSPLFLDGVNLLITGGLSANDEAVRVITAPYGSGGIPDLALSGWTAEWHGNLDGTVSLWLVNGNYSGETALWNGAISWGSLVDPGNWGEAKPSGENAAWMGNGGAFLSGVNVFSFARKFEIGAGTNETGKVSVSGGSISGGGSASAVIVGAKDGEGTFDFMAGQMHSFDYLWNSALTVGADTNSSGKVGVGIGEPGGKDVVMARMAVGGGLSVGAAGMASMEIGCGPRTKGEVDVAGPVAVGYDGYLAVSGGTLVGRDAFYIGRTMRETPYDVAMSVTGGAVSNLSAGAGAFWVGSYGGLGSKAAMTISGGEVYTTNRFVCGGYRSATVEVAGGSLVAPEIRIGHALIDENDRAEFVLAGGVVKTAGFTSGTNGVRTVSLEGGRIVATATNDDFFAGIESVRLDGMAMIENASNIVIRSALTGSGGLVKSGAGTNTVAGYAAWTGPTMVEQGVLDMDGGMVMSELSVAEGADIVNEKYDYIDALELRRVADWDGATTTTSPYLLVQFGIDASAGNFASVSDGSDTNVTKGAISVVETDDAGTLAFAGWTALGWKRLNFRDGSALANGLYSVQMKFDFTAGKPYVFYYVDGGNGYERLVSEDGLTAFPVAGGLSARIFRSVGVPEPGAFLGWQMNVNASKTFYWTGAVDDVWKNAGNWRRIGVSDPAYPNDTNETAYIENAASIRLSSGCTVGSLVANAPVTLSGNGSLNDRLTVWKEVSGSGTLSLSNATVAAVQDRALSVSVALDIRAGTENEIAGDATLYGSLRGAGTLLCRAAKIYGDTQAFTGKVKLLIDGVIASVDAAHNALSSWEVVGGVPFALGGITYEFGALDGSSFEAEDVALVIGAKDVDCQLEGCFSGSSGIEWVAKTASLSNAVANAAYLKLCGGGRVLIGSADSVPAKISFVSDGGELFIAAGVDVDISPFLMDSTAPIVYNDAGRDQSRTQTWAYALSGSNKGGFVKRGESALKWLKAPETVMDVSVEEGVLIVPFGTRLGQVNVANGAKLVVDCDGLRQNDLVFMAAGANRVLKEPYLVFANVPPGRTLNVVYGEGNSIVVVGASGDFVWTGAAGDGRWSTVGNWKLVDGKAAETYPRTNDTVRFLGESCTTVRLDVPAAVLNLASSCDLSFVGGGISTELSFDALRCDVALSNTTVTCGGEFNVRSVSGSGLISVSSGTLVVSPPAGREDRFAGTLAVTNFVKTGKGDFRYVPEAAFEGEIDVEKGTLVLDCSRSGMTSQENAVLKMKADGVLDLVDRTVTVAGFTGAGKVMNGVLVTADRVVTQQGGKLTIPLVASTKYIASRSDEKLVLETEGDAKTADGVTIVIPRSWYAAGASGRRAIKCKSTNIDWGAVRPVDEGDGWWSIPFGGGSVRLR